MPRNVGWLGPFGGLAEGCSALVGRPALRTDRTRLRRLSRLRLPGFFQPARLDPEQPDPLRRHHVPGP
jgi:hypothetical protein